MLLRIAFVGFRHGHIFALHRLLKRHPEAEIVAVCEEDDESRAKLAADGLVATHDSYAAMLADVDCDAVACGDYFGVRGARVIAALEAGKHVLCDKPLCTNLAELETIERLATQRGLSVGLMLGLPDMAPYMTLRELIVRGDVGEVHTVTFLAQHPLNSSRRGGWFFDHATHGGTLNDIAIHAIDMVPWLTGQPVAEVTAARAWNARLPEHPTFQDGGMLMLKLANGAGVIGDVSYLAPDKQGYELDPYWRVTVGGDDGTLETAINQEYVSYWSMGGMEGVQIPLQGVRPGAYFDDFRAEIMGASNQLGYTTARVIAGTRVALKAQQAADTSTFPVTVT
jgi:predicted dehydrogenase